MNQAVTMLLGATALYVAAVAQTTLADLVAIGTIAPDALALVAVVAVLYRRDSAPWLIAATVGLVADLIAPGRFGVEAACFVLLAIVVVSSGVSGRSSLFTQVAACAAASATAAFASASLHGAFGESEMSIASTAANSLAIGVYTAAFGVPVLMVVKWINEGPLSRSERLEAFS